MIVSLLMNLFFLLNDIRVFLWDIVAIIFGGVRYG